MTRTPQAFAADDTRHSILAGTWYPRESRALREAIAGMLSSARVEPLAGELLGLVAPHAGYMYSGPVAAHAYALLAPGQFDTVAVVSPAHRKYPGRVGITAYKSYETPLGQVPVDAALVAVLEEHMALNRVVQDEEHSVEIQLPFLQYVLGDVTLLPLMMGQQDWPTAVELGQAIAAAIGSRRVLLVASSDLSHFHGEQRARSLDAVVADDIARYDPRALMEHVAGGAAEACGAGPIAAVIVAAQAMGANRGVVLNYATSADVTGDTSNVVGYLAAALLRV